MAGTRASKPTVHCDVIADLNVLEELLRVGLNAEWRRVVEADDRNSVFQSPDWTVPWYQCYNDLFRPHVLAVRRDRELIGLIPLAVEKVSGRLAFAGDGLADYRDVAAVPEDREIVIAELLRHYRAGGFPNMLSMGPMLPESDSARLAVTLARSAGVQTILRAHEGWRWWRDVPMEDPLKKKSIRQSLKHYEREGQVWVRILSGEAE